MIVIGYADRGATVASTGLCYEAIFMYEIRHLRAPSCVNEHFKSKYYLVEDANG